MKTRYLIVILALLSLLPIVSANPVAGPDFGRIIFFGAPWLIIIPIVVDAIALKLGFILTKTSVEIKRFAKILLVLWLLGYLADVLALLCALPFVSPWLPIFSNITIPLLVFSTLMIFVIDYLALHRIFKFESKPSKKIALVMGILTNMLLLAYIATAIFGPVIHHDNTFSCLGNPINEIVTSTQRAMSGIDRSTDIICLQPGVILSSKTVEDRIADLDSFSLVCYTSEPICNPATGPLKVDSESLAATEQVMFVLLIHCTQTATQNFSCIGTVREPY